MLGNGLWLEAAEPPPSCPGNGVDIRAFTVRDSAGRSAPFYLLPGLDVEISASAIRTRAQTGSPALVPPAVGEYIRSKGLYR
jgi:nicotinic acid mononucleotide adenylyltransferase